MKKKHRSASISEVEINFFVVVVNTALRTSSPIKMRNLLTYQRLKRLKCAKYSYSTKNLSNLKKQDERSNKTIDMIGPPDSLSNLRPIVFAKPQNETTLEKDYRESREITQKWNQEFWSDHNSKFISERKKFQEKLKSEGKDSLTADEMSVFYKKILDKNWKTHVDYNYSWYKQNIRNLYLEIRVRLSKLKFK